MNDPGSALHRMLELGLPFGIALFRDLAERQQIEDRVRVGVSPTPLIVVRDVREFQEALAGGAVLVLAPDDEAAAVEYLDRNREQILARDATVILLISASGPGMRALTSAPSLASWARSNMFGANVSVADLDEARRLFGERAGMDPENFVRAWHEGRLADTTANNLLLGEAILLAGTLGPTA